MEDPVPFDLMRPLMDRLAAGDRIPHEDMCEAFRSDPSDDPHLLVEFLTRWSLTWGATLRDGYWLIERGPGSALVEMVCPLCGRGCTADFEQLKAHGPAWMQPAAVV
jgi:hypothetical protein